MGMEKLFSTSTTTATQATKAPAGRRNDRSVPTVHSSEPLFLYDVKAEPAKWSQEGVVVTLKRLFGWLPDSEVNALCISLTRDRKTRSRFLCGRQAEEYKQSQSHPYFTARDPSHNDASDEYDEVEYTDNQTPVVEPCNLEHQRMMEEMELTAAEFRKLLMRGFSAHKVMNSGGLKSITVTLVTKENECFLTWDNSRKSNPRIYLHDIQEVVPVLAQNNVHAPKLARKLSQLRGLIILSKSYQRGRMLLQVSSKAERDLLIRGFKLLLEEINVAEPLLDHDGAPRKRIPRRLSVLDFFHHEDSHPSSGTLHKDPSVEDDQSAISADPAPTAQSPERRGSTVTDDKRDVTQIGHFYKTRFDVEPEERSSSKSSRVESALTM